MAKPTCIVMVGLPALGKSTRVDDISEFMPDVFVYSTDNFIEDAAKHFGTTYDQAFKDNIDAATKAMNELLDQAIEDGMDVVWDQTNLSISKRRKIVNRMRDAGYAVECECFLPPEAGWLDDQKTWARRLANRPGKTIPPHIMTNMINTFVVPTEAEGFDAVHYFNMHGVCISD